MPFAEMRVKREEFKAACLSWHARLKSPVMALFAVDERRLRGVFEVRCVFLCRETALWQTIIADIPAEDPRFDSLAGEVHSAALFEREVQEMFGIAVEGGPDARRLHLHDEVWPEGFYPLRKDFVAPAGVSASRSEYRFNHVEGEGVFEVPVGPVHAGIIGPGHFRFTVAGEPIVNLEMRFGFAHRGVEKLFEGKTPREALELSACVAGDSVIGHGWAFCRAVETIMDVKISPDAFTTRAIGLELERVYNHLSAIGGIAVDVGFSFPSQYASLQKERILRLNKRIAGHRYLKGVLAIGGAARTFDRSCALDIDGEIAILRKELDELTAMLYGSVSFMDRVDETGILRKKTAEDFGVVGLAGRASGIPLDLRRVFPDGYEAAAFRMVKYDRGDVLSRLRARMDEIAESLRLIKVFTKSIGAKERRREAVDTVPSGSAIGAVEGARGPVFYWVKVADGRIDRCKIVDASFHNWPGLGLAVLGNIIPDFPVCNKSFDLSYSGNDL